MKTLPTKLDYDNGETHGIPDDAIRINASGISRFFSHTTQWYREKMLGESGFTGNSASVNGTLVHYIAEQFARNNTITQDDKDEIAKYILKHTNSEYKDYNPDIDINYIEDNYKIMAETLVNDYLLENPPSRVEDFVAMEILPNIYVGGSIDNLTGGSITSCEDGKITVEANPQAAMICDYKTTSMRPGNLKGKSISWSHKLQLLTYAWILTQQGQPVDRIRIIYITSNDVNRISEKTGKPLQAYPSTIVTLTEQITESDLEMVGDIIHLIAESVQLWKTKPELHHILAQDMRLKAK